MTRRRGVSAGGGGGGGQNPKIELALRLTGSRKAVSGSITLMREGQALTGELVSLALGNAGNPRIMLLPDPANVNQPRQYQITATGVAPITNLNLDDPAYKDYTTLCAIAVLNGKGVFSQPVNIPEEIDLPVAKPKAKRIEITAPENEPPTTEWWSRDVITFGPDETLHQEDFRIRASCPVTIKDAMTNRVLQGTLNGAAKRASKVRIIDLDSGAHGMKHLLIYPEELDCTLSAIRIASGEEATTQIHCG